MDKYSNIESRIITINTPSSAQDTPRINLSERIYAGVRFIKKYKDPTTTKTILASKRLDPLAHTDIARDIYLYIEQSTIRRNTPDKTIPTSIRTYIATDQQVSDMKSKKIFITHCPSSTFANGKRPKDQLAEICMKIKEIETRSKKANPKDYSTLKIDTALHVFIIDRKNRGSQHDKDKINRKLSSKGRYDFSSKRILPMFFTYTDIYIVDDVLTTGATLNEIKSFMERELHSYYAHHTNHNNLTRKTNRYIKTLSIPAVHTLAYCH